MTVSITAAPAGAEVLHPRQQWLRDSTAGLFPHWGTFTAPIRVPLRAGTDTIRIYNDADAAPDLDRVSIG